MAIAERTARPLRAPPWAVIGPIFAFIVVFILASWGIDTAYSKIGRAPSLLRDLTAAAGLIVGELPVDLDDRQFSLALAGARLALPILALWATLAVGWVQLGNGVRLSLMHMRGDHLVIAGDSELALKAAEGESAGGRRVLLWTTPNTGSPRARAAAPVVQSGETLAVERLGLAKARGVLLLANDDSTNVALAARITAEAARSRPAGDPLEVVARIDDLDLRRSVEQRFHPNDRATAQIRFVSLPDIAARGLFVGQPLDRFQRYGEDSRRVLLLGYSDTIERYLLRMLAGGHFRNGMKPEFIVVDRRGAANAAAFKARNPGADILSPVHFEAGPIDPVQDAGRMIDDLVARHGAPIAIVIDCGDDVPSLALARAIDEDYRRKGAICPPLHLHLAERPAEPLGVSIRPFGGFDHLAGLDMLLQERRDALARSIHDFYLEGRLDEGGRIGAHSAMREWEDLAESVRDDNRLVADCYELKLHDIGARLVSDAGPALRFEDAELEELARAEHSRWMGAKLATGWVHGATRDDAARIHPDIIPYDALSEPIKDLDREQIRIMTRLLGGTGRRAVRTLGIALQPGSGRGLARGLPKLLALLAVHYPDRTAVVAGWLDDAVSRDALRAVAKAGSGPGSPSRVRLLVSSNIEAMLDGLPSSDKPEVTALVRGADTIIACQAQNTAAIATALGPDLIIATMPLDASCPIIVLDDAGGVLQAPWQH